MRLTSKGRYAVTAMLDICVHQSSGAVCLSDIAQRQVISLSYLEQIFTRLRKAELVSSVRGPGGGYLIAKPLQQISVQDIIHAMNEELDARQCRGSENCHNGGTCLSHELWDDLSSMIAGFLSNITLASLVEQRRSSQKGSQQIMLRNLGGTLTVKGNSGHEH